MSAGRDDGALVGRVARVQDHKPSVFGPAIRIFEPEFVLRLERFARGVIGQSQGARGVGVTAVAKALHVSSAFVATETGKLAQAGLLTKRANPKDRRAVLLSLTRAGRALIERNSGEVRLINDAFFGALTRSTFAALSTTMAALVHSSARATAYLTRPGLDAWREAAE